MSGAHARSSRSPARAKSRHGAHQPASGGSFAPSHAGRSPQLGPHYAAGPVAGLSMPVQSKVAVGRPGDAFEQEANAVANHVTSGSNHAPPAISPVTAGALSRATTPDEKKPEQKPAQKADMPKPDEKKPEQSVTQKAEGTKPEEKKPEQKVTQKAEAPKPEEKKPEQTVAQRQTESESDLREPEEEPPVQLAEKPEEKKPEPKPAQTIQRMERQAPAGDQAGAGTSAADRAIANPGPGRPMNPETRKALESRMGPDADLEDVRVHDDSEAQEAASDMNARAFTHGRDIWLGRGESDSDVGLMAHEATHVMQQSAGGGVQRQMIQRQPSSQSAAPAVSGFGAGAEPATQVVQRQVVQQAKKKAAAGAADDDPGTLSGTDITFKRVSVPAFKLATPENQYTKRTLRRMKGYSDSIRPRDGREVWKEQVGGGKKSVDAVTAKLKEKEKKANKGAETPGPQHVFKFQKGARDKTPRYFIGDYTTIAKEVSLPTWDHKGNYHYYQVDHIVELQVANWNKDKWGHTPENLQLLDSKVNQSSGSVIASDIDKKIRGFLQSSESKRKPSTIRKQYDLIFQQPVPGGGKQPKPQQDVWTKGEIEEGKHVDVQYLIAGSLGELGGPGEIRIFPDESGGVSKKFTWSGPGDTKPTSEEQDFLKPYRIQSKQFSVSDETAPTPKGPLGTLIFDAAKDSKVFKQFKDGPKPIKVQRIPGATYAGFIDKKSVLESLGKLELKPFSPIRVNEFDIVPEGVFVSGVIQPDLPVIRDVPIDFEVRGTDVTLSKTFNTGEISVPKPLEIKDSSLTVSLSTRTGLGVEGRLDFGIERVGEGYLQAGARSDRGLELEGRFGFDSKLFDPAEISMQYRDNVFSAEGKLGIKEGKVRGIKSANVTASYKEGVLKADGAAELSIPGIQRGTMSLTYSEAEGFMIAGSFQLASNIPGIQSGSVEARVKQKPGEEGYDVTARGTAVPKIPGVSATVTAIYENGAFTIEGTAAYEKGMLKGSIMIGATNRPVDDQGRPGTGEPTGQLRAYGGGSVTIRIAPWLQGTIGVRLLPNGEIEVSGAIGLPSSIELFPEKRLDKNIFKLGIDIPIVGLSVAGQRVGIFANITGGLDLSAGIGPGQLQELGLAVKYNPDRESETHITGSAKLHVPAHAGLRLFVRGGLGVGIPLVSAQAGIEIGGALGLEGALDAGVQVDWMPTRGLRLDAFGEVYVEPKLKFDVTGFVLVEFDYFISTATLYEKRWQLAAFEYGSGLRFGVKFPVKYEEGKPFDISLSDVQFQVPDIKPKELLSDLVKKIA